MNQIRTNLKNKLNIGNILMGTISWEIYLEIILTISLIHNRHTLSA